MNSQDCNYAFEHKQTKKKIIAQTWSEFYKLQANTKEYNQSYKRLGVTEFPKTNTGNTYNLEQKINNFFAGAKGYEKVGELDCTGVGYNVFRVFLKVIHNHACMLGDIETVKSTKQMDKWFYCNSNFNRLLLTQ